MGTFPHSGVTVHSSGFRSLSLTVLQDLLCWSNKPWNVGAVEVGTELLCYSRVMLGPGVLRAGEALGKTGEKCGEMIQRGMPCCSELGTPLSMSPAALASCGHPALEFLLILAALSPFLHCPLVTAPFGSGSVAMETGKVHEGGRGSTDGAREQTALWSGCCKRGVGCG